MREETVIERYQLWSEDPYFDPATRAELRALAGDARELEERFWRHLEFGTAGLRGLIGAGTNRMNKYTVRRAAQGLAAAVREEGPGACARGVAIAYDSRHFSAAFAEETALTLAANGVKAFLFDHLRPTPLLSFAVRHLGCQAGVVITASHNPAQYNGFKVYWADGCQIPPEPLKQIQAKIAAVTDLTRIVPLPREAAEAAGLFISIGEEVDEAYLEAVRGLSLRSHRAAEEAGCCRVLYTPLHGAGGPYVARALAAFGFRQVAVVPEQEQPDGDFPTVRYPNPEEADAFRLAISQARVQAPALILATDPDADRLGVAVRLQNGEYRLLSGNQIGAILTDYLLSQRAELGTLPRNGVVIKTITTADFVVPIARSYGVAVEETLTGFKFIGEKIAEYERTGQHTFLFGFEESYGYLAGTFVRDKDAVSAAALLAEAAAFYSARGLTLQDALNRLYERHGHYLDRLHGMTLEGKAGLQKIGAVMEQLREAAENPLPGLSIARIDDYLRQASREVATGEERPLTLPKSDVLAYRLAEGGFVVIRPSGTEPKMKLYVSVTGLTQGEAEGRLAAVQAAVVERVEAILQGLE